MAMAKITRARVIPLGIFLRRRVFFQHGILWLRFTVAPIRHFPMKFKLHSSLLFCCLAVFVCEQDRNGKVKLVVPAAGAGKASPSQRTIRLQPPQSWPSIAEAEASQLTSRASR